MKKAEITTCKYCIVSGILLFVIIILSLIQTALYSKNNYAGSTGNEWRNGPFHYIYTGDDDLSDSIKETLHNNVHNAFSRSCTLGSVQFPLYLKIIITDNSGTFSHFSGMPRDAAGCYDANSRTLIIQHPYLLERRGILSTTIYHESLHWMIFEKRGPPRPGQSCYMDEFLTEALSPSSDRIKAESGFFPGNYDKFLGKIKKGFTSARSDRQASRDAVRLWGAYIIKTKGLESLMQYIISGKPGFDTKETYREFLNTFKN